MQEKINQVAIFFEAAIKEFCSFNHLKQTKILDFGCGEGQLVIALSQLGFDAFGCDMVDYWSDDHFPLPERLSTIHHPYRLPFDDNMFDVVVSTSVLEHAQNKLECFQEIYRVLKPGGYAMHLYPGKWYMPYELHTHVPFLNFIWPYCPTWWLSIWAILGVRNEFQNGQSWQTVVAENKTNCKEWLTFWTTRQYRELSLQVFGNCNWPMDFYINNASGGFARLFKRLPFKALLGLLSREMRMSFMIQKKAT